jgi:hypothetical protein
MDPGAQNFDSQNPGQFNYLNSGNKVQSATTGVSVYQENYHKNKNQNTYYQNSAATGGAAGGTGAGSDNFPPMQVPIQQGINQGGFTQPAVAQKRVNSGYNSAYSMGDTITELEHRVAANPNDFNSILALRYLYLALGQHEKAQRLLPNNAESANRALEELSKLQSQVAKKADLKLSTVEVCDKVVGFGDYEVLPLEQLSSGTPRNIMIYCELQNYLTERNAQGKYVSRLHAAIKLYDSKYTEIKKLEDDVPDVPSFNPRRDFFLRAALNLPALSPGKYQISVTIEDKIAKKVARPKHIQFEVKPPYQSQ